jgi:hypothetical protein
MVTLHLRNGHHLSFGSCCHRQFCFNPLPLSSVSSSSSSGLVAAAAEALPPNGLDRAPHAAAGVLSSASAPTGAASDWIGSSPNESILQLDLFF